MEFFLLKLMPTDRSLNSLPVSERVALKELIEAAKYMDTIWNRSVQWQIIEVNIHNIK